MREKGWRTVIVNPSDSLTLADEQLTITSEEKKTSIPIVQISLLLIMTSTGSISLPLLESLINHNISVIFCDNTRVPIGELQAINTNFESAGKIMDQAKWTERRKNAVWNKIVRMKIKNQIALLKDKNWEIPNMLFDYRKNVKNGDDTNREAMAAKVYFESLFGEEFIRFNDDENNKALNYGYTILRNAITRSLTMYGYNSALGIHHCNRQNKFNLSCDLMEPFRPFVDAIVCENLNRELDNDYKKELLSVLQAECQYGNKKTDVLSAIDIFIIDVMKFMEEPRMIIKEISFDKKS